MKNQKILCIVPARGGSKGVHRKNIRNLGGKPLIKWTIDEAEKSKYIDRIIISTEDNEIAEVCNNLGAEVIKRPVELAGDDSPTIDSILYTLNVLEDEEKYVPDYVMLLQCTSPFRTVVDIDTAVETLLNKDSNYKSLISVTKEDSSPWWLKSINADGTLKDFLDYDKKQYSRRQDFPPLYRLNGAIYICSIDELKMFRSFETDKTLSYVMDSNSSVDIDTEEDLELAEYILVKNKKIIING